MQKANGMILGLGALLLSACQSVQSTADRAVVEQAVIDRITESEQSTRLYLSDTTIRRIDDRGDTQLAFLSRDGLMPYTIPGQDSIHFALWDLRERDDAPLHLCLLYSGATYNPDTESIDGPWQCGDADAFLLAADEIRDGDFLGLGCQEHLATFTTRNAESTIASAMLVNGYGEAPEPNRAPSFMDDLQSEAFLQAWNLDNLEGDATLRGIYYKRAASNRCWKPKSVR